MPEMLRVYRMGYGRAINVSRLFPKEWVGVFAEVLEKGDDYVIIKFKGITE